MGRPQVVPIRSVISSTLIISTGAPQGCVLSPLLYTLSTYVSSNAIIRFADDTAIMSDGDESAYRAEARSLSSRCWDDTLLLNKTMESLVDYRRLRGGGQRWGESTASGSRGQHQ